MGGELLLTGLALGVTELELWFFSYPGCPWLRIEVDRTSPQRMETARWEL